MSEQAVYNFISSQPKSDGIAIELGANHGMFTDLIASKFKHCYAFECEPNNMQILQGNCKQPNIDYVDSAIGMINGRSKLYLCDPNAGGHSTCESHPKFAGWGHRFDNYITVPSITLDKFVETRKINGQVKFIKCDIEGAEKFVFDKAVKTFADNPITMLIEIHQTVDTQKLYSLFTDKFGYQVFDINDWSPVGEFQYDQHYIICKT